MHIVYIDRYYIANLVMCMKKRALRSIKILDCELTCAPVSISTVGIKKICISVLFYHVLLWINE